MFIAIFIVAGTMALIIQQREHEIALLRAVAATPGQVRRMIAWEAVIISLVASAAGVVPGAVLGNALARGFVRHEIAPADFTVTAGWLPATVAIVSGVTIALLAVLAAGRRASRVAPTRALADAAVEPRGIGLGRLIGGGIAIAAAVPLFSVSAVTHNPQTAAATSELNALFLVAAVGFLGPIVARIAAEMLRPALSAISPVGGFLAAANLRAATRRFSSASTPLVLSVALSCTLLFSSTTIDHAVNAQRSAGLQEDLAVTGSSAGLPRAALADVRATQGVSSAVALTPTMLGPGGVGLSDDVTSAQVLDGGAGGGLDVGVVAGSLAGLHGTAVALSRTRADAAHAHVGDRVSLMLGDGTPHARDARRDLHTRPRVRRRTRRAGARRRPSGESAAADDSRAHEQPGDRRSAAAQDSPRATPGCASVTERRCLPAPTTPTAPPTVGSLRCSSRSSSPSRRSPSSTRWR